jgi:hypothetical protein
MWLLFVIIFFTMQYSDLPVRDAEAAAPDAGGSLTVSIKDIRYSGNDEYLVTLSVINGSSKEFLIRRIDCRFELQKENGWHALRTSQPGSMRLILPLALAADARSEFAVRLDVPLAFPKLFKTYEGDISLMLTYRLQYYAHPEDREVTVQGESLYWMSPGTSKWIHREGM